MSTALGDKIQKLRKQNELTLDKLAAKSGASKSYVWELENKNPPRPSAEKLSKIAAALGVTLEYLLDDEDRVTESNAVDEMFFRKYQNMNEETKNKVRKMVDLWDDDD
ncbi:helix-turn-helix domain-containing protein [Roseibium sp. MB-4]